MHPTTSTNLEYFQQDISLSKPDNQQFNCIKLPSLTETFPDLFQKPNYSQSFSSSPDSIDKRSILDSHQHPSISFSDRRNYAFIALTERDRKPRPRRRFEEVERLYSCTFPGCTKSYGALNHLNSHIVSKQHGDKRNPQEFCEMRRAIKLRQSQETRFTRPYAYYQPYSTESPSSSSSYPSFHSHVRL